MSLKDLIVPLFVAIAISFGMNYFFGGRVPTVEDAQVERSRVAPKIDEVNIPLNFEVDFVDSDMNLEPQINHIETKFAKFSFSTIGATLDRLEYKHDIGHTFMDMPILESRGLEDKSFLLALEQKTPLNYKLTSSSEDNQVYKLIYEVEQPIKIRKTYLIHKDIPKLDLQIDIAGSETAPVRARLFYPSPYVADLQNDVVSGLVNDKNSIVKKSMDIVKEGRYWQTPTLFGAEDRYFVNAMTADSNNFVQRAYFRVNSDASRLDSILDAGKIRAQSSYNLTFYFGPKKISFMQSVDPRLTGTLEYGWLEPLCVPTMYMLNMFYDHIKNYGWAIVLLTILIKLIVLPFSWKSQSDMIRYSKSSKEMESKMEHLKQKYKDNKEALQREQAELIKKHGIPGMGGCLPMLIIQVPLFFALQRVLYNSIELYKAPFLWVPDLSNPDPYFILPALFVAGMALSNVGMPNQKRGFDPKSKLSQYAMAVIIGAAMTSMAAGIVIYVALSQLLTVLQNYIQSKLIKRA